MSAPEKQKIDNTGRLHVAFDCADVLRRLGTKANWRWLRQRLLDMQSIVISVKRPGDDWGGSYSLIEYVGDTPLDASRNRGQFRASLKKIIFTQSGTQMLLGETGVYLQPDVCQRVLNLQHQVSRALVRWCLSHASVQNHSLKDALDAVGCGTSDKQRERYAHQLRNDADGLAGLGVDIKHGRGAKIHYHRLPGVWFRNGHPPPICPVSKRVF